MRVKANSKSWFGNQIVLAIQIRDKFYKKSKYSGLENHKGNFKAAEMHLLKMILQKKKSFFKNQLAKNRNKLRELWKALKSLRFSSNKASKSNISLKKDIIIQFEAPENANIFKRFYSELAKQPKTTTPRLQATYPITLNCQTYLKRLLAF